MTGDDFCKSGDELVGMISEAARLHLLIGLPETKRATTAALRWRYQGITDWHAERIYDSAMTLLNVMPKQ